MGQYYRGVVLGKTTKSKKKIFVRKAFCCYAHDNGAKLMEHSYVGNWYVKEYENVLANQFYGYPFVWVGDYADEKYETDVYSKSIDFIDKEIEKKAKEKGCVLVQNPRWGNEYVNSNGENVSFKDLSEKTNLSDLPEYDYIINITKRIFVKIPKTTELTKELTIHPLPLLCADGNGRGGGDYLGTNMDLIGSWAYDRIGVTNKLPENITRELVVNFVEEYDGGDSSVNDYQIVKHKKGV